MNLLIEHSAQTHRVEPKAALFRAVIGVQVKLAGRMPVDVTVETSDAQAGAGTLAVVGRVEFFLRERREQEVQSVELNGRQDILEESIIVVDRDDLAARDIAELGPALEIDRRWKLGQEGFGQVEIDVKALEPGKHGDLHFGKDLAARRLLRVGQRWVREGSGAAGSPRGSSRRGPPRWPLAQTGGRAHAKWLAARHLGFLIEGRSEVVALFEKPPLRLHDAGLGSDVGIHVFFKALHRLLGVQRIAVEVETKDLPALGLVCERRRGGSGLRSGKPVGLVVRGLLLLGASGRDRVRRLRRRDGVTGRGCLARLLSANWLVVEPKNQAAGEQAGRDQELQPEVIAHGAVSVGHDSSREQDTVCKSEANSSGGPCSAC